MDTTAAVPVRKTALNFLPEAVLKRDVLCVSPAKERCAELSPVPAIVSRPYLSTIEYSYLHG